MVRRTFAVSYRAGRKLLIGAVGAIVLVLGVALLVLPGPAVLVIPMGLGILAAEFPWFRRWLRRVRGGSGRALGRLRRRMARSSTRAAGWSSTHPGG